MSDDTSSSTIPVEQTEEIKEEPTKVSELFEVISQPVTPILEQEKEKVKAAP